MVLDRRERGRSVWCPCVLVGPLRPCRCLCCLRASGARCRHHLHGHLRFYLGCHGVLGAGVRCLGLQMGSRRVLPDPDGDVALGVGGRHACLCGNPYFVGTGASHTLPKKDGLPFFLRAPCALDPARPLRPLLRRALLSSGSPRARRCLASSDLGAVSRAGANQSLALYALSDLGAARRTALIVTESLLEKNIHASFRIVIITKTS